MTTPWVRRSLLAVTAAGIVATAFELASERHWNGFEQLIPWAAAAVLTVAVGLACTRRRAAHLLARTLALMVMGASLYGVLDHAAVNHHSGPLDQRYADSWDAMSETQQWWYAVTKMVGPAPVLAPGILAQTAFLLILASALRANDAREFGAVTAGR
ncbi:hypothetical protein [Mycobacterium sp. GA-2829]|uniref:hypothetical protein n=1 Tax=Mycobacterium sp. GA-2829 TaxID=1772283 RepID=UPI00074022D6|nr:hypothetical protein [Mycobacterium sp. GA-2829]KUI32633.1 hypothetical protein AU194_25115 [Mycobacterium sp. GA-2829]